MGGDKTKIGEGDDCALVQTFHFGDDVAICIKARQPCEFPPRLFVGNIAKMPAAAPSVRVCVPKPSDHGSQSRSVFPPLRCRGDSLVNARYDAANLTHFGEALISLLEFRGHARAAVSSMMFDVALWMANAST